MTDYGQQSQPRNGLPLEKFTHHVPPGWAPRIRNYTFHRYAQRLKLWYRTTPISDEAIIGPLIVSRLKGEAFRMAMAFRIHRNGVTYSGDEALALPGDPSSSQASGIKQFLEMLKNTQELHDQDRAGVVQTSA